VQKIGLRHLRRQVKDEALRKRLTPDYTLGCKRLLMSNSYYRALTRPNVTVHPTATRIEGSTVIDAEGARAEVDTIILGTGFHVLKMPIASRVFDARGRSLDDHWKGSPQAYLGTSVTGFPNLFLLLGPNLGTGHSSAFSILEAQLAYVMDGIAKMRAGRYATFDVRPEVQAAFNAEVQAALPRTVYNSGCSSYYLDQNGNNAYAWPWSTTALIDRIKDFDLDAYTLSRRVERPLEVTL
jgi:cation diffusion facilitator CzcD-associated flavoprotein CzcO